MGKKATLTAAIVTQDKSSKNMNIITKAAGKMGVAITKASATAGNAFTRFSNKVGLSVKKISVSLNTLNARINRVGRNIKKALGTFGLAVGFTALAMAAGNTIGVFADYEQANASLTAVMGTTLKQNEALFEDSKRLGATTAKTATEVVGLQEAFGRLGFEEDSIINMTEATISGSVAMKGALSDTAELVGAMVKSFDGFDSIDAPDIIDKLTLSTQKSALNFTKLQTGLPIVAGAANAAGVKFTKLLASMGKLSDAGIDASSSTTALRNIYLEAAKQGVPYESLIKRVANSTDQLATANDLFGKRGAVAAVILAKNIDKVKELDIALQSAGGTAATAAAKQLDTFKGSLTILGSAWQGYILSVEDGTGATSEFLKTSTRVITDMLSMASNTAKAKDELNETELRIRNFAETGIKLLKIIKNATIAFIAFKTVVFTVSTALKVAAIAQNIWGTAQAVSLALQGKTLLFLQGNTAATLIYSGAMKAQAAATWLMNAATTVYSLGLVGAISATWAFTAALLANPMTWVVIGIVALIAAIVLLVKNWDAVSAAIKKTWEVVKTGIIDGFAKAKDTLTAFYDKIRSNPIFALLTQPIIFVVESVKLLIKSFTQIKDAFKFGGMIEGFKEIGKTIINFLILPFKIFLEALAKIPKVGKFAQVAVDKINKFQDQNINITEKKLESVTIEKIQQKELANKQIISDRIENKVSTNNITTNSFFNNINQGRFSESVINEKTIEKAAKDKEDAEMKKLVDSLNANADATNENSDIQKAVKDQWKGKFFTSILKDANVSDRTSEIAKNAIRNEENVIQTQKTINESNIIKKSIFNEENITNEQKTILGVQKPVVSGAELSFMNSIKGKELAKLKFDEFIKNKNIINQSNISNISNESNISNLSSENFSESIIKQKQVSQSDEIITPNSSRRRNETDKSEIIVTIIDRTGDNFDTEVESTGINVVTTGNA